MDDADADASNELQSITYVNDTLTIEGAFSVQAGGSVIINGHLDMQAVRVCIGVNRDRRHTHPPGGAYDAAGDFAPVGDQDFFEVSH